MLIPFLLDMNPGRADGALQDSLILAYTVASHHCKTGKPRTGVSKSSILRQKRNIAKLWENATAKSKENFWSVHDQEQNWSKGDSALAIGKTALTVIIRKLGIDCPVRL